ncbi:hypothetical protein [Methanococcus maripaludis]|uniref:PEGA domain-containing protein n=1 Tax=Methanococcus maripaludis TaxID=39152 RepID=A0A7J9PE29_METMI|nr:hypothetical protein [Methanococcus maripaludis]MBA2860986.1 hypothetical protein [Methanococcus maripaludis]
MIKRYILFLLVLMCAVGTVNAVNPTVPDTCTATEFYVILSDDTMSQDLIISTLSAYDFSVSAPVISGVDSQTIYFESENDLGRFCSIISYTNKVLPFAGAFDVYKNGERTPMTVILLDGQAYTPYGDSFYQYVDLNMTGSQIGYVYAWISNTYSQNYLTLLLNDATVVSKSGDASTTQYLSTTFFQNNILAIHWKNLNGYDKLTASIVLFDYVDSATYSPDDRCDFTVSEIYTPPERATIDIYTEPAVDIYNNQNNEFLGTTDNGGYLALPLFLGETTLKFVKDGYWDTLKTFTVTSENNSELFITMAPSNAIFQVSKEFSGNIYPNSVARLSMDINPVKTAYATKLRVSGVEVNKVYYQTQELPKAADGSYIIGDMSSPQNIVIDFKTTSSWGERAFTVELSATDIEGTAYTNLETINYNVLELPFLFESPDQWAIGTNEVTLTDMSGESYSVLMVLYDESGTEKWSSSTNLLEYCEYTFEVPVEDAGEYTLELNAKSGTVKSYYSIEIIEPVSLVSDFLTANPGKVATVQFKISNPTESVKYYTAELSCPFYNETVDKTFSIAPGTVEKTVDISFEVPEGLELEYYQLTLEVFNEGSTDPIYSGHVVLTISNESLLFASVPGGNTTLILLAAAVLLIAGTFAALRLKK